MKSKYFKLFSTCVPVKGAKRSIICDLQRQTYDFIPNDLYEIFSKESGISIEEYRNAFSEEDAITFEEYLEFLIRKEYGFYCDESELNLFPPLSMDFEVPGFVSNSIIDIGNESTYDLEQVLPQLQELGCKYVQIRFFKLITAHQLDRILELFQNTRFTSIQMLLQYSDDLDVEELKLICWRYLRITQILVVGAPHQERVLVGVNSYSEIVYTNQKIVDCNSCGIVNPEYFTTNIAHFTESLSYNTCLNKKLSVDINGNIKNCPSLSESYGNIKNVKLASALENSSLTRYWAITKDQIEICRDCEFRRICTDCRAYISNPSDLMSKPVKCSYDPYTATWV